jgi:hypothetical protein
MQLTQHLLNIYGKRPINSYSKTYVLFLNLGVFELLRQLFYVQINYQNGYNLRMYELLGRMNY